MYNGTKAKRLRLLDNDMMKEFIMITTTFIDGLKIYTGRLTLRTPTKYNPATEYKILSDETAKQTNHTADIDEKLIYETQVLAVIALLCTDVSNTTHTLLFDKCEELARNDDDDEMDGANRVGSFVDILTDVLCAIGHSVSIDTIRSSHNTCHFH